MACAPGPVPLLVRHPAECVSGRHGDIRRRNGAFPVLYRSGVLTELYLEVLEKQHVDFQSQHSIPGSSGLCGLLVAGHGERGNQDAAWSTSRSCWKRRRRPRPPCRRCENEFAPRRRELLTMQNDLKAKDEKLQKEGAVMPRPTAPRPRKTLRDQQREFSRKAGRVPGRCFDARATRKSARCSATSSRRSRATRTRRASIWCWATACSSRRPAARHHRQRAGGAQYASRRRRPARRRLGRPRPRPKPTGSTK